jgi:bifunctional DNA-binding transcriptional regulator/antitoxin component of YhaV-PrlF toxin-antitoxin module
MEISSKAEQFLAMVDAQNRLVIDKEVRKKLKIAPGMQIKVWVLNENLK